MVNRTERWDGLSLARSATNAERRELMRRGTAPDFDRLVGWEFAGVNTAWHTPIVGIRKFKKGFYRGPARAPSGPEPCIHGYNVNVRQNGVGEPHIAKPSEDRPTRHSFYRVYAASAGPRRNYDNALMLDYGLGGGFALNPARLLRDYLVQVYPDDPDLLLGHAFAALGIWIPLSFFVLVRNNEHDFSG